MLLSTGSNEIQHALGFGPWHCFPHRIDLDERVTVDAPMMTITASVSAEGLETGWKFAFKLDKITIRPGFVEDPYVRTISRNPGAFLLCPLPAFGGLVWAIATGQATQEREFDGPTGAASVGGLTLRVPGREIRTRPVVNDRAFGLVEVPAR